MKLFFSFFFFLNFYLTSSILQIITNTLFNKPSNPSNPSDSSNIPYNTQIITNEINYENIPSLSETNSFQNQEKLIQNSSKLPFNYYNYKLFTNYNDNKHPYVISIPGQRTTACSAKFRSLSSRSINMWWDDKKGGVFQGTLLPGQESTTNTYEGHVFFFTDKYNKNDVISRILITKDLVLYPIKDEKYPATQSIIDQTEAEVKFNEEYLKTHNGIQWRHYYGPNGPRQPPILYMVPAEKVGQQHTVITPYNHWNCDDTSSNNCVNSSLLTLTVECISLQPRAFIVENFLSEYEADHIVNLAKPKIRLSTVGNAEGGGIRASDTRTSHNTWLSRETSSITETITRRVADVLGLDESILKPQFNSEEMQVVHYINGQKYDSHHDWGVSGYPESRYITMLMYLTTQESDNAGGETAFPKGGENGGIKVKPVKGTAVFFYNLLEDGNGDDLSLHAALPVWAGEKWLANYWIWDPKKR